MKNTAPIRVVCNNPNLVSETYFQIEVVERKLDRD